jgi:ketosteroid isomerase-like protein
MADGVLDDKVRRFFDEFVEAFKSFDGARVAERYCSPYLAFHANGQSDVFASQQDIATYFQRVLDGYHGKGVRSCSFKNLHVVAVGGESAFATVTWKLHAADGAVVVAWRESYNLWLHGGKFLVFASIDHVGQIPNKALQATCEDARA